MALLQLLGQHSPECPRPISRLENIENCFPNPKSHNEYAHFINENFSGFMSRWTMCIDLR
eukprot:TRINITY_DN1447_c0_g2_i1.p2 TRINITY_DN1447_c0_g2~~TRINITY_DN1447_c0_g2_i1.p2  ORF type:complete len:60 (+),score=1.68 TRINITY_DN1447_c0_g2_i1:189-368(+)